jgi:hypothetical protein
MQRHKVRCAMVPHQAYASLGAAVGADYWFSAHSLVGFALAGGGTGYCGGGCPSGAACTLPALLADKIFQKFSGNSSVTVKGSLRRITRAFRIQTKLFWNATGRFRKAQTKREQGALTVNEKLRKALDPWA